MSRNQIAVSLMTIATILSAAPHAHAEEPRAAFAMSLAEFAALSEADQKAMIKQAFERRLEHARNVHYAALSLITINSYANGKPGEVLEKLNGRRVRHWRLGESYRMDTDRGGYDVSQPEVLVASSWDAKKGMGRATNRSPLRSRIYARIDVVPDRSAEFNRYAYWLDGEHNEYGTYICRHLVEHFSEHDARVELRDDGVHISLPWYRPADPSRRGTRTMVLSPEKGFMPVHGRAQRAKKPPGSKFPHPLWEEFEVKESTLVGDVWMPRHLVEIRGGSAHGTDRCNVFDVTVSEITAGNVTPAQLEVPFEEGMQVVDAIKGITYTVGADLQPVRVESVIGAATPEVEAPSTQRSAVVPLVIAHVGVGFIIAAVFIWRRRRAARVSSAL